MKLYQSVHDPFEFWVLIGRSFDEHGDLKWFYGERYGGDPDLTRDGEMEDRSPWSLEPGGHWKQVRTLFVLEGNNATLQGLRGAD